MKEKKGIFNKIERLKIGILLLASFWLYQGLLAAQTMGIEQTIDNHTSFSSYNVFGSPVVLWAMLYFSAGWLMCLLLYSATLFLEKRSIDTKLKVLLLVLGLSPIFVVLIAGREFKELILFLSAGACIGFATFSKENEESTS